MNNSNKMPFLLAAGAIGSVVGYLVFTDSGKRVVDNIARKRVEKTGQIPEKIDNLRSFIAERGKDVTGLMRDAVDHVKGSVAAGQRAYDEAGGMHRDQIAKLHRSNAEVIANLHKAVDNIGKLFETVEQTFLDPIYEMGAIARGVDRGARHLVSGKHEAVSRPVEIYPGQHRVIG